MAHNPTNLEHAPAKLAGGMRVKGPNPHRIPLKGQEHDEEEEKKEGDHLDKIDLDQRRAQDIAAQTAAAQINISKNPGTQVRRQINNPETQPRSFNH